MKERKIDIQEFEEFLKQQTPETKIYIGGDSRRTRIKGVWYADFATVIVVHMNGNRGGRIFGEIVRERDYDQKKNKPTMRLMTEVMKIAELYKRVEPVIEGHEVEVHLDLNSEEVHGSNHVVQQALGYIRGTCNVEAKIKPEAWSASYCADRLESIWTKRKSYPSIGEGRKTFPKGYKSKKKGKKAAVA